VGEDDIIRFDDQYGRLTSQWHRIIKKSL
jgi:hypothetical protein